MGLTLTTNHFANLERNTISWSILKAVKGRKQCFTLLRIISGARYSGVPHSVQVLPFTRLAKPKSVTWDRNRKERWHIRTNEQNKKREKSKASWGSSGIFHLLLFHFSSLEGSRIRSTGQHQHESIQQIQATANKHHYHSCTYPLRQWRWTYGESLFLGTFMSVWHHRVYVFLARLQYLSMT